MSIKRPTSIGGLLLGTILFASVLTNAVLLAAGTISPSAPTTPASGVYFDHLVVIMMENEGISNICGGNPPPCNGANTPYESSLANSYGISQQDLALINTSWPDYYGIIGASIFGCPTNCYPPPGSVTATNLVDRFEAAGVTWKGYFENQPVSAGCATSDSEPYTFIHNGFVLFQDITSNSARCNNLVLANPTGCSVTDCALISDLNSGSAPNFMWLSPSHCNDMQGSSSCSNGCTSDGSTTCLQDGDNYLKSLVPNILSSTTFQTGRSALFLTFDEGIGYCPLNSSNENCVYAVWAGPVAKTSYFTPVKYNHYSLTKTIEANWNLASLTSNDAGATPMSEFFVPSVQSPDFSISANPASMSTTPGSSTTSTITVTSLGGFTGPVSLSAASSPSGPSVSLSPSSVTLSSGGSSSSTLTVTTQSSTPTGTYNITVTGSSGSTSHSTNLSLTVSSTGDFSISANPSSLSLTPGSSGTSTITLTSLSGFSGTINLTASVSPSGPNTSLNPSVVTVPPGGSASSTLSITTTTSTPGGTYNVTATGTSGAIIRKTTCTVNVVSSSVYSLMVTNDGRVFKYLQSGTLTQIGQPVTSPLRQVAWKPDASYALIVGDQAVLLTYNGATLTRITTNIGGNPALYSVAWRPDGSYALIVGQAGVILKYDGTTLTRISDTNTNNLRSVSWKPDGSSALIVGDKGTALLYSASGSISTLSSGTGQALFAVSWDPTGSYALASGGGGVVLRFDGTTFTILSTAGLAPTGKNIRSIGFGNSTTATLVGDSGLFWTFDGTRLVSISSGTNQNLFSTSWLNNTAYAVGQGGTILSYSNGVLKRLTSTTTSQLNGISWKPFIAPVLHPTSTSLACNPSTMVAGAGTTCTVIVADSSPTPTTPTGTVSLTESGVTGTFTTCTLTGTNASATCTSTFATSSSGTAAIAAQYPGDTSHQPSSGTTSVTVNKRATTTTVSCTSPVTIGTASTCNVTVADSSAGSFITPTGTVSLSTNGTGTFSGTCALSGNTASATCSVTYTPSGSVPRQDMVNATYAGDTAHSGGSATFNISVVAVPPHSTTTVVSCNTPVVVDQGSTCTATVTDTSSNPTTPTGTVTFNGTGVRGSLNPSSCSLANGNCSVTFTPSATGNATVTAVYGGDSTHVNSSGQAAVSSTTRLSSMTMNCSPATIPDNTTSTCTVTVTDASGSGAVTPTGTVTFTTNSTGIFSASTCILASGSCGVNYTPTVVGHALITGSYGGDSAHTGSSGTFTLESTIRTSGSSVTCVPAGVSTGQATTCTVTVSDTSGIGAIRPTGTVTFSSNSTGSFTSSNCTLSNGSCSVTYMPVTPGHHVITGTYGGDAVHSGSGGTAVVGVGVTIDQTTTSVNCSPATVVDNTPASCTATVTDTSASPTTPTGAVSFATNSTGTFSPVSCTLTGSTASATCKVTYTPTIVGHHLINGNYAGDSSHASSSGQFTIASTIRSSSTGLTCTPASVNTSTPSTCTVTVADTSGTGATTPTGIVTFASNSTGSFGSTSCVLSAGSCSVTYTPTVVGHHLITSSYGGDASHTSSQAIFLLASQPAPLHSTTSSIACSPSSLTTGTATSCTATVTDTSSGPTSPTGTVNFVTNSTGTFSPGGSCNLASTGTVGVSTCTVSYTPGVAGGHRLTGTYAGDSSHGSSSGTATLTVTPSGSSSPYALVVSEQGSVFKYQNGSFTLIGQPVTTPLRQVSWKPDGSYALIVGDSGVLLKYDGTQLISISTGITANLYTVSFRPDGSYALIDGSGGPLFKYNGTLTRLTNPFTNSIRSISWNPSGSQALLVGASGGIFLYQASTGSISQISSGTTAYLYSSAWNPNGLYALAAGDSGAILRIDGTTVTPFNTAGLYNSTFIIHAISWNPTGTTALLVGDMGTILTYNGSQLARLQSSVTSNFYSISWLGSTAYIAGGSGFSVTYTNGVLSTIANNTGASLRYWAWKPN